MNGAINISNIQLNREIVKEDTIEVDINRKFVHYGIGEKIQGVQIESYLDDVMTGNVLFLPLISPANPLQKQAVFLSDLSFSTLKEGKKLIREALMFSWEMDYHVAFSFNTHPLLLKSGFQKASKNFFYKKQVDKPVLLMELSWEGEKQISNDLLSMDMIAPVHGKHTLEEFF